MPRSGCALHSNPVRRRSGPGNNVELAVVRLTCVKEFADVADYDEATKDMNRFVPKVLEKDALEKINPEAQKILKLRKTQKTSKL